MNLYNPSGNKNNSDKKEINFFDDEEEEEDILNYYENYIDGNLIQIYLPNGKNLNKIFLKSKEYLSKNNNLILEGKLDNEYNAMQKNSISLINLYIKEKLEKIHYQKMKKLYIINYMKNVMNFPFNCKKKEVYSIVLAF